MKADPRTVALLAELGEAAADGLLQDLFVVYRLDDGEYGSCYRVVDLPDMLCQVRTEIIRAQTDGPHEPTQH